MKNLFYLLSALLLAKASFAETNYALEQRLDESVYTSSVDALFSEGQRLAPSENIESLAEVVIVVNRAPEGSHPDAQKMKVYHRGVLVKEIKVSTGKYGHSTPVGHFRPVFTNHMRIYRDYFSGAYSGSPMKWAVFFNGGIALHSTTKSAYKNLGKRASHGCVRMTMEDAQYVNELIRSSGSQNTVMKKWRHAKHAGTSMWNEYFKGSEIEVPGVSRYGGELTGQYVKSVDTVIAIVDERL